MKRAAVVLVRSVLGIAAVSMAGIAGGQQVFINELHYDNIGTDAGEFVEIAGPAGTDLTGWSIVRYNGSNPSAAVPYASPTAVPPGSDTLGGTIPNSCGGYGTVAVAYAQDGLQNGPNDGLALVDNGGVVVQFLGYEGVLTAATGPAAGLVSTGIPVAESNSPPPGSSLHLVGTGTSAGDFTWAVSSGTNSQGACNPGQTFTGSDAPPQVASVSPAGGATNVPVGSTVSISFTETVTAGPAAFTLTCSVSGDQAFTRTAGPAISFTLMPTGPLPAAESCTVGVSAASVADADGAPDAMAADFASGFTTESGFGACGDPATAISEIQGPGATSPVAGEVRVVEGVVTGDFQLAFREGVADPGLTGFFIQEEPGDQDASAATSEGIFVFEGNATTTVPDVEPGDLVRIRGTVTEFVSTGITLTELATVTNVLVCGGGFPLPVAAPVTLPIAGVGDWERYEGMRVSIGQPMVVTGNFNLGPFGEVDIATGRLANPTNAVDPGPAAVALLDQNGRSRLVLDDGSNLSRANFDPPARLFPGDNPVTLPVEGGLSAANTVRLGDAVGGGAGLPLVGILDQRFGAYRLHPTAPVVFGRANPRTATPAAVGGNLRVGSFNVLNYFTSIDSGAPVCGPTGGLDCRGADSAAEFVRQRDKIVSAIAAMNPHVLGLIELENNPSAAIADLVAGLNTVTAPGRYAFIDTGTIGTDAIRVGLIYQPAVVTPVGDFAVLDNSVDIRAIDTLNRPPLAQTFTRNGARPDLQRFTVVVNHFKSKGSDCATPDDPGEFADPNTDTNADPTDDGQDDCNLTRISVAQALADWLAADPTDSNDPDFLIIGDLNAYTREHPIKALTDPAFDPPDPVGQPGAFGPNPNATFVDLLPPDSYSYQFGGQSGHLDHALASPTLRSSVTGTTIWHINADEPLSLDYNAEWTAAIPKNPNQLDSLYDANAYASSDHDPLLVGLNLLCGDLDDDADVDATDRNAFRSRLGTADARADYDRDGTVTQRDYTLWYACYREFVTPPR